MEEGEQAKALWNCRVLLVIGVICLERNNRIVEEQRESVVEELWEKVVYWSSFWASVSAAFLRCKSVFHFVELKATISYSK